MTNSYLWRKWTFRAHGAQIVFVKRPIETTAHLLMKAFLWALYLPEYPDLAVEIAIGVRYKPDVVALHPDNMPRFWGEAGHVGVDKLETVLRRYRSTHFAFAKWHPRLDPFAQMVASNLKNVRRTAPIDLLTFPDDSAERFIAADGTITLTHANVEWRRIE